MRVRHSQAPAKGVACSGPYGSGLAETERGRMRGGQASAAKAKTSPSRATGFLLRGAKRGPVTGAAPAPPSSLHQILSFLTESTARLVPNLGPGMGRVWGLHESCNFSGTFCISKPRVVVSGAQLPKVAPDVFLGCLDNKPAPMGSLHPDPRERRSDSVG